MAKRFAPAIAAVAAAGLIGYLAGRRRSKSQAGLRPEDLQAALLRLVS